MSDNTSPAPQQKPSCFSQFNFCFWSKLLVAIPVLPLVALAALKQFTNPFLQIIAAVAAVAAVIYIAKKIDKLPMLSRMVIKRKS